MFPAFQLQKNELLFFRMRSRYPTHCELPGRAKLIEHEHMLFASFARSATLMDTVISLLNHSEQVKRVGETALWNRTRLDRTDARGQPHELHYTNSAILACSQAIRMQVLDMIETWAKIPGSDITALLRCGLLHSLSSMLTV